MEPIFFETVEEVKDHHPVLISFSLKDVAPFIRELQEDVILEEILGETEYDNLKEEYNSSEISEDYSNLLSYVRDVLAPGGVMRYIPFAQAKAGQTGLMVINNGELSPAPKWMVEKMEVAAEDRYGRAVERLYRFLEKNIETFTDWAASDNYTVFKKCFIQTVKQFEDYIKIGGKRRMFLALKPFINRASEEKIKPITGAALYEQLLTQIKAGTVSAANKSLLKFIEPAVANYAISFGAQDMALTLDDKGWTVYESTQGEQSGNRKAATAEAVENRARRAQQTADNYQKQLSDYLYAHHAAYTLFEEDAEAYTPDTDEVFKSDEDHNVQAFL